MKDSGLSLQHLWLARFAKLVVLATFALILVGGHTTTSGAGMAFADWPLSAGSLNPAGWWNDFFQRLEHGHRLIAEAVGLMVGILCAWIWEKKRAVPGALAFAVVVAALFYFMGSPGKMIVHGALGSVVISFIAILLFGRDERPPSHPSRLRWLAFGAFIGVCIQALLGGLRVTIESGGNVEMATAFRILHGCFAQLELVLLVLIAAMLSPVWTSFDWKPEFKGVSRLAWFSALIIYIQLIVGAAMRHKGAGLAIQTFPKATPEGDWLPVVHNTLIDLNFSHTRIGALIVAVLVCWLVVKALANESRFVRRPAALLIWLVGLQIVLGVSVVVYLRPPLLATVHVINGAAVLATTVLLAVRTTRRPDSMHSSENSTRIHTAGEVEA
ncbi:MAG: cytochrome oxidase assembly [Chthoniobacteraceae bacterium]|nr:cytochrome oxidase assembly [Chthoniobacteraceae bacterium]